MARPYRIDGNDAIDMDDVTRIIQEGKKIYIYASSLVEEIMLEYSTVAEAKMKFNELFKAWQEPEEDEEQIKLQVMQIIAERDATLLNKIKKLFKEEYGC